MTPRSKQRSLRSAVLLLAGACLLVFIILFVLVFTLTMPGMLLRAEDQYRNTQLEVVENRFESVRHNALLMAENVAVSENAFLYATGQYPAYIEDSWPGGSLLHTSQHHFIYLKDTDNTTLYKEFWNFLEDAPLAEPAGLDARLDVLSHDVLQAYEAATVGGSTSGSGATGIVVLDDVPYYICVVPILAEHGQPAAGTVALGTRLDEAYFRWMSGFDEISFSWDLNPAERHTEAYILPAGGDHSTSVLPMEAFDETPIALVIQGGRQIYQSGMTAIFHACILLGIIVVLLIVALYVVVSRLFLRPLERLNRDIAATAPHQRLDAGTYSRTREFVELGNSINTMLTRIDDSNISLQSLQNILNGMNAFLYVSDIETDEILFANDKIQNHYAAGESLVGKTCWQVLQQGMDKRCEFCPVHKLEQDPTTQVQWEECSTVDGRWYQNTDKFIEWTDGRMVHIQYSDDFTEEHLAQQNLSRRLAQQQLMTAMSQSFISTENIDVLIQKALQMAGEFTGVSKVLLGQYNEKESTMDFRYQWYNDERGVPHLHTNRLPLDRDEPAYNAFLERKAAYTSCDDVVADGRYTKLAAAGTKSFMTAAIYDGPQLWGMLSFQEMEYTRSFSESDIQLLQLIANVVSGAISRAATEMELVRMSSIVESSPQFITCVDSDGVFTYISPGAARMSGYSIPQLQQGGVSRLFSEEEFRKLNEVYIPAVMREGFHRAEMVMRCRDGSERIMSFSAFTINTDKAGFHVLGVGVIGLDVTAQRQMEADLVAAKEEAERSNHAKSDFLSRMSHEMRTPMNAIIGMTGIAKASHELERKDYCLDKIDEASKHLLGVINDILDMSKIEAGKFELSESEFDFEQMLKRVGSVINFRLDEKNQNLMVKLSRDVPKTVIADEQRLSQVLTNLLANAIKFTPSGGSITLQVEEDSHQNGVHTLLVSVNDTGIGISKEDQKKLFRSFEQADGGIARRFGGTGLGLAISKSIVEMMGGRIWVESEPDKGSRFHFTVPLHAGAAQHTAFDPSVNWSNLRVLVVDDAPEVREYFLEMAQQLGFACTAAGSGEEALRLLEENQGANYDLIFVDWRMPGMDGVELASIIKQKKPSPLVVMISAARWDEMEPAARQAGIDGFMPKPLFPSLLVDSINRYMGSGPAPPKAEVANLKEQDCFAGRHILLAEDIDINREIVAAMLEHTGVQLDYAENGAEAVALFEKDSARYDLILMDIHMPEMDGFEATRRIRALRLPRAVSIPIVAMTANVFREDVERCLAAGMNDHIGKPVDEAELLEKLSRYLPAPAGSAPQK